MADDQREDLYNSGNWGKSPMDIIREQKEAQERPTFMQEVADSARQMKEREEESLPPGHLRTHQHHEQVGISRVGPGYQPDAQLPMPPPPSPAQLDAFSQAYAESVEKQYKANRLKEIRAAFEATATQARVPLMRSTMGYYMDNATEWAFIGYCWAHKVNHTEVP